MLIFPSITSHTQSRDRRRAGRSTQTPRHRRSWEHRERHRATQGRCHTRHTKEQGQHSSLQLELSRAGARGARGETSAGGNAALQPREQSSAMQHPESCEHHGCSHTCAMGSAVLARSHPEIPQKFGTQPMRWQCHFVVNGLELATHRDISLRMGNHPAPHKAPGPGQ